MLLPLAVLYEVENGKHAAILFQFLFRNAHSKIFFSRNRVLVSCPGDAFNDTKNSKCKPCHDHFQNSISSREYACGSVCFCWIQDFKTMAQDTRTLFEEKKHCECINGICIVHWNGRLGFYFRMFSFAVIVAVINVLCWLFRRRHRAATAKSVGSRFSDMSIWVHSGHREEY